MFSAIKRFFLLALRRLWSILRKVISGALERFLADFIELGKNVVRNLVDSDFSNEAKRKQAFARIKTLIEAQGKEYKDSWIAILIELALQSVKKEL